MGSWHVALATVALMACGLTLTLSGGAAGGLASAVPSPIESNRPVETLPAPAVSAPPTAAPTPPAEKPEDAEKDEGVSAVEPVDAEDREQKSERKTHETVKPHVRDEDSDEESDSDHDKKGSSTEPTVSGAVSIQSCDDRDADRLGNISSEHDERDDH